jgi:hypothetical protein
MHIILAHGAARFVDSRAAGSTTCSERSSDRTRRADMRFLSMIRIDERAAQEPTPQLMQDMGALLDQMIKEGVLISTAGLRPTREGRRVRLRKGRLSTIDGPFVETKEVIGGFAIFEAPSMDAAVEHTQRFLRVHGDTWDIECEVRQLDGPEFGRESGEQAG